MKQQFFSGRMVNVQLPVWGTFWSIESSLFDLYFKGVAHKIKTRANKNPWINSFRWLIPEQMTPTLFRSIWDRFGMMHGFKWIDHITQCHASVGFGRHHFGYALHEFRHLWTPLAWPFPLINPGPDKNRSWAIVSSADQHWNVIFMHKQVRIRKN